LKGGLKKPKKAKKPRRMSVKKDRTRGGGGLGVDWQWGKMGQ